MRSFTIMVFLLLIDPMSKNMLFASPLLPSEYTIEVACPKTVSRTSLTCDLSALSLQAPSPNVLCEGDAQLNLSIAPVYIGTSPDLNLYGVYIYVVDANTGNIEEVAIAEPDLTAYAFGDYEICTVQYLLTDESLLPVAGQTYTNIQADIDNGVYCAFIECQSLTIEEDLTNVDMDWDNISEICSGVSYSFK